MVCITYISNQPRPTLMNRQSNFFNLGNFIFDCFPEIGHHEMRNLVFLEIKQFKYMYRNII